MHYPPVSNLDVKIRPSLGEEWDLPKKMNDRTALLKKFVDPKWPIRKGFSKDNGQGKILTNHFTYTLTAEKLYEYKILDLPQNVNRRLKVHNFKMAIEACTFLQQVAGCFVTDDVDTIISWKPIHNQMSSNFALSMVKEDEFLDVWTGFGIFIKEETVPLRFAFVKELRIRDLESYSMAHPDSEHVNFIDISKSLNILVSRSLDTEVYKQSANKFFVKTARNRLGSSISLETVRGYFYNVKPGMGNIIINFNLATSAFFRPILVSQFLNDRDTFGHGEAPKILTKLRVCLEYDRYVERGRQKPTDKEFCRTYTIHRLSKGPIADLTFKPENSKLKVAASELSVVEHLKSGK